MARNLRSSRDMPSVVFCICSISAYSWGVMILNFNQGCGLGTSSHPFFSVKCSSSRLAVESAMKRCFLVRIPAQPDA